MLWVWRKFLKFFSFTWTKWRQNLLPAAAACRTKPRWQKARRSAPPGWDGSETWISSFSQRRPLLELFPHSQLKLMKNRRKTQAQLNRSKALFLLSYQFVFSWDLRLFTDDSAQKSGNKSKYFWLTVLINAADVLRSRVNNSCRHTWKHSG